MKNVDLRITKSRKALFSLLGPAFAYKCSISPVVKLHLLRTFINPVLKSGLNTFSLRDNSVEPLMIFHRKTLKSILKLSLKAPTPSIHFLTGELPINGQLHRDIFMLFYNIWSNSSTKMFQIVKHLLENCSENSRTWTAHLRYPSKLYSMEDPLSHERTTTKMTI